MPLNTKTLDHIRSKGQDALTALQNARVSIKAILDYTHQSRSTCIQRTQRELQDLQASIRVTERALKDAVDSVDKDITVHHRVHTCPNQPPPQQD